MKKNLKYKRFISLAIVAAMTMAVTPVSYVSAAGKITVDGEVDDWKGITSYESTDSKISKWSVARDDSTVYFYVQQNGGNQWGQPITDTSFKFKYEDGTEKGIRFTYNFGELRDGNYGSIDGAENASKASDEKNKYEAEFSVPAKFFGEDAFDICYCGSTVPSSDITDLSSVEEGDDSEPVYSGIKVDGNFSDWKAVEKTDISDFDVNNHYLTDAAMVFDGEYVYIYLKETADDAVTGSGPKGNGNYELLTDTGRRTTFGIKKDSSGEYYVAVSDYIEDKMGDDSIQIEHSNKQCEIAIPVSALKKYNETISFGYALCDEKFISDVANLNPAQKENTEFSGIVYDGLFGDWENYPHSIIEYSTSGAIAASGGGDDAEAALYVQSEGGKDYLYGHVKDFIDKCPKEFNDMTIRFNEDNDSSISFRLVSVDSDGNIDWKTNLTSTEPGEYTYALFDRGTRTDFSNINDELAVCYGEIKVTVKKLYCEAEYRLDLGLMAEKFNLDTTELKMIQAKFCNIGDQWITYSGASTAPFVGVGICCLTVVGVFAYRKRKQRVKIS